MMPRMLALCLLSPLTAMAAPHLELTADLNPQTRSFTATASLADAQGLAGFRLGPGYEITALSLNGAPANPAALEWQGPGLYRLPEDTRNVSLSYQATLQPLAGLDHRQVLGALPAMASPEGSFLPSGAGWYPDPGTKFSYRVSLSLPPGEKGLVPGDLVRESEDAKGYRAEFAFPQPAEGIDLMAGPYAVSERILKLASGREIRIRTWFHPELDGLAPGYLEDSARYIGRYSDLIGAYPFGIFSIVSSPLPTGFGMPSLTYLGRDVLRLPFIRATSLGHEVLHNWWGNGVYPDWRRGNWSEGLTTFLADYAYKEDQGEAAAREMRLAWLRDLVAVPEAEDTALKDFVSRHHGISSIVGYNKSAMVFSMLRDRIGRDAFERGLHLLWERFRFRTAAWEDLEAVFSEAAGCPLGDFFHQWLERPGAPSLRLVAVAAMDDTLRLEFSGRNGYALRLPLRLNHADRGETRWIDLNSDTARLGLDPGTRIVSVQLDPDFRVWRRLDPALLPAILREVFVAAKVSLVVIDGGDLRPAAHALAERLLDATPASPASAGPLGSDPLLIVGTAPALDDWLAQRGFPPRPEVVRDRGSAQVWAGRDASGRPYAVVSARDAATLRALERGLPHYGRQGWLVFDGARAADKGTWPPKVEEIRLPDGSR